MKIKKILLPIMASLTFVTVANAGDSEFVAQTPAVPVAAPADFYVGASLGLGKVNSYYYGKDTIGDLTLNAGYEINKFLAVELRATKGVKKGDQLKLDYSYGVYLKPKYQINSKFSIYGLLGYAKTKIVFENEEQFNGITNNYTTQNDISYGLGVDYKINYDWSAYLEAVKLIDKKTTRVEGPYAIKVNTLNVGVTYHF